VGTALQDLAAQAATCTRCPLHETRTQVVFGVGDPSSGLMFVGEAPGREEDLKGEPFVGRSGQLLDRLVLEEVGLTRSQFYIANVIKCLRYNARVQLGDGSWERIGRLVTSGYRGDVMSVLDGHLVRRKVVGWYASPLGDRSVFRLSYRHAKAAGATARIGIELTGDHPVLTDRGWVTAEALQPDDRVATGQGLSARAFDVVCGTLLGDGHLNAKSSHLAFSHSRKQAEYAELKAMALTEFEPHGMTRRVASVVGGPLEHEVVTFRTLAHRSLRVLRADFHADGRKVVPPWIAHRLNPRMLAIWYLDDGHLRIRENRRPVIEISTSAFGPRDLEVLRAGLHRLGIVARVVSGRLALDADATHRLCELVAPFTPPSMRYKLPPEIALRVPFGGLGADAGPVEVLFDEVVCDRVDHAGKSDKTFFCIDVEETHNFVTSGGVVHNSRPPGNRDPSPLEIEACWPWLEAQLAIIDPKVVVTLGNFASKLLLATSDGITKLRGRSYPFRNGVLIPTFHPAAVLRGGGGPMAQVRADLIRVKEALGLAA
jgi:uracil-DNA glycosylase family 4